MAYLTDYGGIWGSIPNTAGQVHWVAPGSGAYTVNGQSHTASDGNDGLSPEKALATIGQAVTNATANAGDVIVLLPGTHSPGSSIALSKAGLTLMGLPSGRGNVLKPKATIAAVTGDQTINVTAANVEIAHANIVPVTADTAIDVSAAGDGLYVHDCRFDFATPAANTGTIGIEALGAAANVLVQNCYWECDGAQGDAIVATALVDSVIEDCTFSLSAGTWASVILCGAGTDRLIIRRCNFYNSGTAITAGVNGTGADQADGVTVHDCRFDTDVTVPIDNFSAGECNIAENYDMGVGSTDGGALITAIT